MIESFLPGTAPIFIFRITLPLLFLLGEHDQMDCFVDVAEHVAAACDSPSGTLNFFKGDPVFSIQFRVGL